MATKRTVAIEVTGNVTDFNRALLNASSHAKGLARDLDSTSSQMGLLVSSSLALGPALVPLGASVTPVITGLASQLGFAALGAGVAAIAFTGMGDALKSVNDYQLNPTKENIAKMSEELSKLGPAGRDFVEFMQSMRPQMQELQETARAGLLPGVESGMNNFMEMMPQVERIISNVAEAMGDMADQAGEALAGPRWESFFDYLENEARPTLEAFGQTLGNFVNGIANLFVAFAPASASFSSSFLEMSRSFADWTANLPNTEGFQGFLDYLADIGPKVWDTLTSLGGAIMSLLEAAAPIGSILLPVLSQLADAFSALMDTDVGPVLMGAVVAINALALAMKLSGLANIGVLGKSLVTMTAGMRANMGALRGSSSAYLDFGRALDTTSVAATRAATSHAQFRTGLGGYAKAAGAVGILAFAMSDLDDKMGLSNTAMGATIGMIGGPWGVALGAGIGAAMDFAAANDEVGDSFGRVEKALQMGVAGYDQQVAALGRAKEAMDKFKKDRDNEDGGMFQGPGDAFADQKNLFEGLFGKSDVEEQAAKLKELSGAVRDSGIAKDLARAAELGLATDLSGTTSSLREQTLSVFENIAAHNARANQALTALDKEVAWQQSIDAASESLKKNGASVDSNTEAGQNNLTALSGMIKGWNDLGPAAQASEGAYASAHAKITKMADAMGYSREKASALATEMMNMPPDITAEFRAIGIKATTEQVLSLRDQYELTPDQVETQLLALNLSGPAIKKIMADLARVDRERANPTISVNDRASGKIRQIRGLIDGLTGKSVTIETVYKRTIINGRGNPGVFGLNKADGGYIAGPGGPRDDSIPAMLSNGEYVINAAATKRNLGLLHQINAQKFAAGGPVATRLPAQFVGGGVTGASLMGDGGIQIDYDALAAAMSQVQIVSPVNIDKRTAGRLVRVGNQTTERLR